MKNDKENPINKLTIVGGQAFEKSNPSIFSTHIEKILIKAASDETFKKELMEDRKSVLEKEEINPTDKMLLGTIPLTQLSTMIDRFGNYKSSRREFLKGAAASAALLTGVLMNTKKASAQTGAKFPPACEKIGPEGGTLNYVYTPLKIVVPPKALNESVSINISTEDLPGKCPENAFFIGTVYKFSPENIELLQEASIYFPIFGELETLTAFFWEKSSWKEVSGKFVPSTDTQGWFVVETCKFGIYVVGVTEGTSHYIARGLTTEE